MNGINIPKNINKKVKTKIVYHDYVKDFEQKLEEALEEIYNQNGSVLNIDMKQPCPTPRSGYYGYAYNALILYTLEDN